MARKTEKITEFTSLKLVEKPTGMLSVLVYLLREGETSFTALKKGSGLNNETCYSALRSLEKLGLVYHRSEKGWPCRSIYGLTASGLEIADDLLPVESKLNGTFLSLKEQLALLQSSGISKEKRKEALEILLKLLYLTFISGDWEDTLDFCEKALELSDELGDSKAKATAYRRMAHVRQGRNEYEKARLLLQKSLKISSEIQDLERMSEDKYSLGAISERWGNYEKALRYYQQSEELARKSQSDTKLALSLLGMGRLLAHQGQYEESSNKMKKAIGILEEKEETDELPRAYANLAATMFYINLDEALEWNERCMEVSEQTGNVRMLGYGLSNVAGYYADKGMTKKSKECLERALEIFRVLEDRKIIASIYSHYGTAYKIERKWRKSAEYFGKSLRALEKLNDPYRLALTQLQYGLMLKDKGDERDANRFLSSALEIFKDLKNDRMAERAEREIESLKTRET